ncbi:hypothetical protein OG417_37420 [Actinoallomurus sp. NBC_01490]|jgi:hypothetical protein|uniref:hypothetical protein n=1 Tax=Actinoallomurus sp. NBC_01490 TaxID=2903557 RepID=UPI002E30CA99|nr:hypothetical protein [Actinoallomurus sp. NBC_01490]
MTTVLLVAAAVCLAGGVIAVCVLQVMATTRSRAISRPEQSREPAWAAAEYKEATARASGSGEHGENSASSDIGMATSRGVVSGVAAASADRDGAPRSLRFSSGVRRRWMIGRETIKTRFLLGITALGGWAAIPIMMFLAFVGQSHRLALTDEFGDPESGGNGWAWAMATLAMTTVAGGMIAVAAVDATRTLRDSSLRPGQAQKISYAVSILLSVPMWIFGGIISIGSMINTNDCGSGAAAPCLDHPGLILYLLFVVCLVLPTLLLVVALWLGRRSRICALLAPPLIFCVYFLAIHLHLPHVGFGDTTE